MPRCFKPVKVAFVVSGKVAFAHLLAHSSEKSWKRGWAGKEEVGGKIAKVFETCQRSANINVEKKLEAKKRWEGVRRRELGGDAKVQSCLKAAEPQIDRQALGRAGQV